jgi:hypothetical protein
LIGWHHEHHHRHRHITDSNGHTRVENYTETVTVEDFDFSIDVSDYISPTWDRLIAVNKADNSQLIHWKQVVDEFTSSKNYLKEIHLEKEVLWDYDALTQSIILAIRSTGYPFQISVTYPKKYSTVSVFSSSSLSKFSHNTCVKVLCVITCLCIIFYRKYFYCFYKTFNKAKYVAIFLLSRKNINKQLFAYYVALRPGQEFFQKNIGTIHWAVMTRTKFGVFRAI